MKAMRGVSEATARALQYAKDLGWDIHRAKRRQHFRLTKPGHQPIFMSASASDWRAARNVIAMLKREEREEPIT